MDQQNTPQWSPPPQQPAGWGASSMGPVARPLGVTLSAIWFYFIGILGLLVAVVFVAGGNILENIAGGSAGGVLAGAGMVFGFVVGLIAVLMILVGWGVWTGRGWGRIGGIVLAVLGVLTGVSALSGGSTVTGIVELVIWGGIIYALWMAKGYFAARAR